MKKALYIDWLAISYTGSPRSTHPWRFDRLSYSCKEFRTLFDVYYFDDLVGRYYLNPNLPDLPSDLGIFKLANERLYKESLEEFLLHFRLDNGLEYKSISRVDVCSDFHVFEHGRSPEKFIKDFMSGRFDNLNKMTCQCARGPRGTDSYESLTFGARTSSIRCYLYNKTKEMSDHVFKTWIKEADELNGISWDRTVWRLEFSIKGDAKLFADTDSGEMYELSLDNLLNPAWLSSFYDRLCAKYFSFVAADDSKNRYRAARVDLLGSSCPSLRRLRVRKFEDVNRADRIFAKKFFTEIQADKEGCIADRPILVNWAYEWARRHHLETYVAEKVGAVSW